MKRKLSALLAIVLAVVMVFPTAIFVGAAVESAANMIATISGTIDDAGKQLDPIQVKYVDTKMTQSVNLAYDDEADLKVVLDEVYANFSIDKKTDNGVVWIEGTGSDYKIVTGDSVPRGTAYETFDFVADKLKTNKDGSLYKDKNGNTVVETEDVVFLTLTVNVKPIKIVEIDIYGYGVVNHDSEIVLDGDEKFNSKDELTLTKVHVVYNNATEEDIDITDKNLEITVDCVYPDKTTDTLNEEELGYRNNKFALRGDYMQLNYTYTGKYGMHNVSKSGSVELSVTSTGVVDVTPIRVTGAPINNITNMTEDGFLSRLNVSVAYKELSVPVIYTKVNSTNKGGSDYTVKFYEDSAYRTEISFNDIKNTNSYDAYFTITVEDKIFYSGDDTKGNYTVQKYFDVKEKIPREVTINWDKAVNKTYNEGYRIGTEDKDWSGVVVNVWYDQDTTPTTYTSLADIAALDIILSPTVANQKFVTIESVLGEPIGSASNLPTGFNIIPREVIGITLPQDVLTYTEGQTLSLSGIKATLKYNFGENAQRAITNDEFSCSPKNGAVLTADDDEVLVVYKDPNTGNEFSATIPLKVNAKKADSTIKEVILVADGNKTEYFIGESFEKDGYKLFVTYNDKTSSKYVNLSDCTSFTINDTAKYNKGAFVKAFSGSLSISFKLPSSVDSNGEIYQITLENITVTKRPVLLSVAADSVKDEYMLGDSPEVQEFTVTAKYDDNSTRVFKVNDNATDAEKAKTTYSYTTGGVTYTIKLTPTTIAEDTKAVRVTYTEKVSGGTTTTKYDDVEIKVIIPDAILSYYDGGWQKEPYMDFDEALKEAEDYADTLSSSYQQNRKPSIQLCRDITVLYDYSITEYIEIDLNGFDITMVPGEIFVKSSSSAEITFVNNGDEASKIIYSKTNDDDNIIINEDDSYVIDANSGDGKYQITITKPTGGKVTGPEEVTHGHDVKFTITPDEDYEVKTVTVKEGKNTKKYENKDNVLTVKDVQGALTVTVTFQEKAWENPFTDVYKSATYYKSIQFVYENGLFSGMSATKFEPDTTMTRAMFVTVLGRLAGIDADEAANRYGNTSIFSDVSASDASIAYAVPYIKWATDNGLIEGYGNGKFGPKDNITHIQMYVLMQRYAAFIERLNTGATGTNIPANDVKDIPTWSGAYEAVEYAAKHKFLVTSSNRLTPNGNAKRSELAVLLEKFCTNVLEWED